MASNSNNKQANPSQFSLKHRLIGAGILISFGVLILPWMLGSYSTEHQEDTEVQEKQAAKPSSIATIVSNAGTKTVAQQQVGNDKSKSDSESKKSEVKVFKSRVQPIETNNEKVNSKTAQKVTEDQPKSKATEKKTSDKPKEKVKVVKNTVSEPTKKQVVKKVEEKKLVLSPKNTTINRGYIVSIGVFGDTKNVEKMVADLKSKKFDPEVRKETFNKKSVSRIYMGPYSTRAEAGKVKLRLSEKGISKTLIKTFP